jgi:hypothetical protein
MRGLCATASRQVGAGHRPDDFLPDWRSRHDELNDAPLADERWLDGRRSR